VAGTGGGDDDDLISEINVTPLVDVVLVLLIIFLVTMPVLMKDISIDIPKKSEENLPVDMVPPDQLVVEYKEDGRILLNTLEVNRTELAVKIRERLERKREKIVFVQFDDGVRYGDAVSIMDTCKGSGASTVALKMADEGATPGVVVPATPVTP
jgi:biopolymer transport protein ExbD